MDFNLVIKLRKIQEDIFTPISQKDIEARNKIKEEKFKKEVEKVKSIVHQLRNNFPNLLIGFEITYPDFLNYSIIVLGKYTITVKNPDTVNNQVGEFTIYTSETMGFKITKDGKIKRTGYFSLGVNEKEDPSTIITEILNDYWE